MKNLLLITCFFVSTSLIAQTKVEKGTKLINGEELHYRMQGTGEPLIVLHGGPGMDGRYLHPEIDKLDQTYRLISYNQRGFESSLEGLDTLMLTADQFVNDLEEFRKAMGLGKINLMGHS